MPDCAICSNPFSIGLLNSLAKKDKRICAQCTSDIGKDVVELNGLIAQLLITIGKVFELEDFDEFTHQSCDFFEEKYSELSQMKETVSAKLNLKGSDDDHEYIDDAGCFKILSLIDIFVRYTFLKVDKVLLGTIEYEMDKGEVCVFCHECYLKEYRKTKRGDYEYVVTDDGVIYLTTKRVLFVGQHKTLQYPLSRIKETRLDSGLQLITGEEVKPKAFSMLTSADWLDRISYEDSYLDMSELTSRFLVQVIQDIKKDPAIYRSVTCQDTEIRGVKPVPKVDVFVDDSSADVTNVSGANLPSSGTKTSEVNSPDDKGGTPGAVDGSGAIQCPEAHGCLTPTLNTKQPEILRIVGATNDRLVFGTVVRVLNELIDAGVLLSSYKEGRKQWIECKYDNEEICYLLPEMDSFKCQFYDEDADDWIDPPATLRTYEEWQNECKQNVFKYIGEDTDAQEDQ